MKCLVVAFFVFFVITLVGGEEKYTTKYDYIDLEEIMSSRRLLRNYVNCLVSKGSCTPDAAELKKVLPEAIATECAKCSDKQRAGSKKVLIHMLKNEPEMYGELAEVYDPNGEYKKKYCAMAIKDGMDVEQYCN